MSSARFAPAGRLRGVLRPPPDKSVSHRAAILAAMAEGESEIEGYLDAADTRATLRAIEALGAAVEAREGRLRIRGVGLRGPRSAALDVGNAGTLLRILPGWLAGQGGGRWTLDGDASIRRRPVDRIVEPLTLMGGAVSARDGSLPPLAVEGRPLTGIKYRMPVASAQVKSCLLLAGLLAAGRTEVVEPAPTRDHTERMLRSLGVAVGVRGASAAGVAGGPRTIAVEPADALGAARFWVPGDISSAAFFIVAAAIVPGSEVRVRGVGLNPTRVGLLGILTRMGAGLEVAEERDAPGGEVVGELVSRPGALRGTRVTAPEVPLAIDELPLVALAACFAEGETVVSGAGELRHKESDRIAAIAEGLGGLGADVEAREDGFAVRGSGGLRGGRLDARGDHRMAMLGAIAGLASREGVEVEGFEAVEVSYPGFAADLERLAAR